MKAINIERLARDIFTGRVSITSLPKYLYRYTYEQLLNALYEGFGKKWSETVTWNEVDRVLMRKLRINVYHFSAAKTFHQVQELSEAMYEGDKLIPFRDFKKKAKEIATIYNETWLATEYNTVLESASSAASWERFNKEKKVLPILRYDAVETACKICTPLDGIALPIDHPFWDNHNVPQHFNCRCFLLQEEQGYKTTSEEVVKGHEQRLKELKSPMFMNNPGKSGQIFTKKTPYFAVPKKYKKFAEENFGLEIPDHDPF